MSNQRYDSDRKKEVLKKDVIEDLNADSMTGELGSHPLATGIGSASGAVTGAVIGSIGGPLGMLIGGTVGAIAGGMAGSSVGEQLDPTIEDAYWRD